LHIFSDTRGDFSGTVLQFILVYVNQGRLMSFKSMLSATFNIKKSDNISPVEVEIYLADHHWDLGKYSR